MDRRARARFVHISVNDLTELEDNLNRLTLDILDATIDDLPRRYQRCKAGVSGHFSSFLQRVSRAIMYYHEHH